MNFFHFHDTTTHSALRTFSKREHDQTLRSDGMNLAAYLLALKEGEDRDCTVAWHRINKLVTRVAPCVMKLMPTLVNENTVRLDWIDDQGETLGCHHLSDGTLRAIALITALAQPVDKLPSFISIDEPELGLHPTALTLLSDLVYSAAPHCQILLATQSPALLDLFEVKDVIVTERENGASVFKKLNAEELKVWLDDYSLAKLYNKNVLGGRP